MPISFLCVQEELEQDSGNFLVLVQRKSGILSVQRVHMVNGTEWNSQKTDTQSYEPRVYCREVSSREKAVENCRSTNVPMKKRLKLLSHNLFLQTSSIFTEQSRRCVTNMKPFTADRGDLMIWWDNQLCSVRSKQKFLWRVMIQQTRIFYFNNVENELRSYHNKIDWVSKFCMDARLLNVVEIGQYFMTEDTGDWTIQYSGLSWTHPREDSTSQPKGWIQRNTKIGPVLEVTTSYLHGKHGVEIRILSLSRDNSLSWVRISHGSNKFVMDLHNNDTEIPEDQALQLNAKDFVGRSKAKTKPQRREPADSSSRIVPTERRMERFISGKSSESIPTIVHWSDDRWKACLAAGGVKRRFQYWTADSELIVSFRALQGHSGRNLIDPSLQDNVVFPIGFFQYFCHIGSAFNLHYTINSGLILGGQNLSNRQTIYVVFPNDFFEYNYHVGCAINWQYSLCFWTPWTKTTRILTRSTWKHRILHNTCTMHGRNIRTHFFGSTSNLLKRKDSKFYRTRSNAIILRDTLPAYCIPKVVRMETGEVIFEKVYASPRFPPKISLKQDWMKELGAENSQRPGGEIVQQSKNSKIKPTKSKPTSW